MPLGKSNAITDGPLPANAFSLGFKMALTAATRMSDVHSILFEVLGSIPEYISNAERYKSIYKSTRNIKLVKKTVLLYTSIVVALTEAFSYLRERSLVTPLKAYLLGQRYQKKLEEKLKAVSGATEAVKAEATLCLHEVNAEGLVRTIANEDQSTYDDNLRPPPICLTSSRRTSRLCGSGRGDQTVGSEDFSKA